MRLKGTATVEAAMIFPLVFLLLMVFLQYALYLMTWEHVQAACNEGILAGRANVADETAAAHVEDVLKHSLAGRGTAVSVRQNRWLLIPVREIKAHCLFTLFFPMKIGVCVRGYEASPEEFSQITDLIWECAGTLKEAGILTGKWCGGG